MAGTLSSRNIDDTTDKTSKEVLSEDSTTSDIEIYAKEVLHSIIADNLPPTPNNYSLYFNRLLEEKSEKISKEIYSVLEPEENNDAEDSMQLEETLKQGFKSIKGLLGTTANLYKNGSFMIKMLDQRKKELSENPEIQEAVGIIATLEGDVDKLNSILKDQSAQMKTIYDDTAKILKKAANETTFDNQFGVYNKRYLLAKLEQEIGLVKEFNHTSSLIMIELSKNLKKSTNNEKVTLLMSRSIARLLLKISHRNDVVAHYGKGVFSMLLKNTDIKSAIKSSEKLFDLVSNSNFYLADREMKLKVSIGVTNVDCEYSVEEIIMSAMDGIEAAYMKEEDYSVSLRS